MKAIYISDKRIECCMTIYHITYTNPLTNIDPSDSLLLIHIIALLHLILDSELGVTLFIV